MISARASYILAAIIAILVLVRFVGLNDDPPPYYHGHGQAVLTDPYHLTYAARSATLYDDWNPYDFHRWDLFKYSLVSGASYIVFSLTHVSRVTANLTALALHLGGLLFFLLGLYRLRGKTDTLICAALLIVNSTLFFYGRLPFLENGLIFLSGLMFFFFVCYHDKFWGIALSGALVALAALAGKLFGVIVVVPALLTLWITHGKKALKPSLHALGGFVLAAAVYLGICYEFDITLLLSYYREQTTGMYGAPPGLTSVKIFYQTFATYGGESGLYQYTPFLIGLSSLSLALLGVTLRKDHLRNNNTLPIIFCALWVIIGALALSPFLHRPIRYSLFLYPPAAVVAAYALVRAMEKNVRLEWTQRWIVPVVTFMLLLHAFTQAAMYFGPVGGKYNSGVEVIPVATFLAALITGGLFFLLPRRISGKIILAPLVALAAAAVINQGRLIFIGLSSSDDDLATYNIEIESLISPEAVLSGPYAPAMSIDNELKGVIYHFGLTNIQRDLFERFAISHLVTDQSNMNQALKDFPGLKTAIRLARLGLRDRAIDLYRLTDAQVPATDYEKGILQLSTNNPDSGKYYLTMHVAERPENMSGRLYLSYALMKLGELDSSAALMNRVINDFPTDHMPLAFAAGHFRALHQLKSNAGYLRKADSLLARARELNQLLVTQ